MKTITLAAGLLSLASAVLGQDYNTTGPYALKVKSSNETIDGQYLGACHEGAAIEGLCLAGANANLSSTYYQFYLNSSVYSDTTDALQGMLFWELPFYNVDDEIQYEGEAMRFQYSPASNIAVPQFFPGAETWQQIGIDADNKLFISTYFDESTFAYGTYPDTTKTFRLYQWVACMTYTSSYYYEAAAWNTGGVPKNPTCQPIDITVEEI